MAILSVRRPKTIQLSFDTYKDLEKVKDQHKQDTFDKTVALLLKNAIIEVNKCPKCAKINAFKSVICELCGELL
jgi:uncharacterized OB-fold protein